MCSKEKLAATQTRNVMRSNIHQRAVLHNVSLRIHGTNVTDGDFCNNWTKILEGEPK